MTTPKPIVIALDLEGTLISNAVSQFPRPGLLAFFKYCQGNFSRVVIFTSVNELRFREIAQTLVRSQQAPSWFIDLEYINWSGKYKDLAFVPNPRLDKIIIIDDREEYIKPEQKDSWLYIPEFSYPYLDSDRELEKIIFKLDRID